MNALVKDFVTGSDDDLLIKNGDFAVDYSDEMHIEDILKSTPGTWKQSPIVGVGIRSHIDGDFSRLTLDKLSKRIKLQLTADGFRVNDVEIKLTGNEIQGISVNAER